MQSGRPLQGGGAGFGLVRPNTVVQQLWRILLDLRHSVLGDLCRFRSGVLGGLAGDVRGSAAGPYLPGQQHRVVVGLATEDRRPDVDVPFPPSTATVLGGGHLEAEQSVDSVRVALRAARRGGLARREEARMAERFARGATQTGAFGA